MDRRAFLGGALGLVAAPLAAEAQSAGRTPRIGYLAIPPLGPVTAAFREELRRLGYVEGQSLILELRSVEGRLERLPDVARELVSLRVDVLVASGMPAALAAKQATSTIPIVATGIAAPVECRLVASLARPGGNITGGAAFSEVIGKHLELLTDISGPTLLRVGMLWNPDSCGDQNQVRELQAAARSRNIGLQLVQVRTLGDFETAFRTLARQRTEALLVTGAPPTYQHRRTLAELAKRQQLPLVAAQRQFAEEGALATYGPNLENLSRQAAIYVDRILKGAKPGDLPMEQPTKFELVVNLKTAKALGLTIPQSVLLRADEVTQ